MAHAVAPGPPAVEGEGTAVLQPVRQTATSKAARILISPPVTATPNGLRFTGADRAPRPWLLEDSKAAVRVRCNRELDAADPTNPILPSCRP
jgi:hypothetical protein